MFMSLQQSKGINRDGCPQLGGVVVGGMILVAAVNVVWNLDQSGGNVVSHACSSSHECAANPLEVRHTSHQYHQSLDHTIYQHISSCLLGTRRVRTTLTNTDPSSRHAHTRLSRLQRLTSKNDRDHDPATPPRSFPSRMPP